MNYDDWKLASPPENGDVSPCCGDPQNSESEDDDGYTIFTCSFCFESFNEPIPDYEYEENMREHWADMRMDEERLNRD